MLGSIAACHGATTPVRAPVVNFTIDAPLCSMALPVIFSIDHRDVAIDTFLVHLAHDHLTAGPFATSAGDHVLSARSVAGYVWPDRSVSLGAGSTFTDSLPFYCS
jgi:hypothetical protein